MRNDAGPPGMWLTVNMRRIGSIFALMIALSITAPAHAYSGRWLVVENRDTGVCYRLTQMPDGPNWVQLGIFNTFRDAGRWTWEHRGAPCRASPVYGNLSAD